MYELPFGVGQRRRFACRRGVRSSRDNPARKYLAGVLRQRKTREWMGRAVADGGGPMAWLIPALKQPAGNHLRLDLGRAFENVEDARVA